MQPLQMMNAECLSWDGKMLKCCHNLKKKLDTKLHIECMLLSKIISQEADPMTFC